jgi:uncharacterized protein YceK
MLTVALAASMVGLSGCGGAVTHETAAGSAIAGYSASKLEEL